MKTAIVVPFRPSPERAEVWGFVSRWIEDHYPMPTFVADSNRGGGVFSPSRARNYGAQLAGDWDVVVFHDADTIAHPEAVAAAIEMAAASQQMVVSGDSHMYCCPDSSRRIMESGSAAFARPVSFDSNGIYGRPCSGVLAVNRDVFERVGGYVSSLSGYGYEDLVFLQMCGIFADGNAWVPGHITLHLWHPPSPRSANTQTNRMVWQRLTRFRRAKDAGGARRYLAGLGHEVP